MKALVLYYSKDGGNTELIAKRVAEGIGADIERVETVLEYDGSTIDDQTQKEIEESSSQISDRIRKYVDKNPNKWII